MFTDVGQGHEIKVPIRWVWDLGISSTMCSGSCYYGVACLLVCLRKCGRLGGFLAACSLFSDKLKDREEEDEFGPLGLDALLLASGSGYMEAVFGFGPLVHGLLLCFVFFEPVVG